ncbi:MAG: hypothetical protein H6727_19755 [Myxococcales bacterium]|nr:hypothetical protein [Myxococcales bacterium]
MFSTCLTFFAQASAASGFQLDAQTLGLLIALGIVAIMLFIIFIKTNLVLCSPNEVVIITGRQRKQADGSFRGYRILRGGRGFKFPIVESVSRLSLTNMLIEMRLNKALTRGIIPIQVMAQASVKIGSSDNDGLPNAIERFLGKNLMDVAAVARESIEGTLRGVLASVTPEEANIRRLEIADEVAKEARKDLQRLGLILDFFKIQDISDAQGYLEAIGRKETAEVIKNARIAEATADAQAREVAAEQKRKGRVAEATAELEIVEAENKLAVHTADLQSRTNEARERSVVAGQIARVESEQQLESNRVELNRKRYEADTIVPAEAQKRAAELQAIGSAAKILENGRAMAEAVQKMEEQWKDGQARDLFLIQMLPHLLDKVTRVVADNLHIEKVTVLDAGNGEGIPTHVKNVTGAAIAIMEQLKNATGIDVPGILANPTPGHNIELPKDLK